MSDNQDGNFTVRVNNEDYIVEQVHTGENAIKFKVSTFCEYMFTIETNDSGSWKIAEDVIPLDDELIQKIGSAIEGHDL